MFSLKKYFWKNLWMRLMIFLKGAAFLGGLFASIRSALLAKGQTSFVFVGFRMPRRVLEILHRLGRNPSSTSWDLQDSQAIAVRRGKDKHVWLSKVVLPTTVAPDGPRGQMEAVG